VRGRVVGVVNEDPSAGLKTSQRLTPAASTRACAGSGHGAAVFTTGLPSIRPCGKPAAPLRHVAGFPGAGLLRGLCHARAPSADGAPARHPAGHRAGRAAPRRFPRSLATGQRGRDRALPRQHHREYAAGLPHGLPGRTDWTTRKRAGYRLEPAQHCTGPHPPGSGPFSNHGASATRSRSLSLPALLARPTCLAVPRLRYVVRAAPALPGTSRIRLLSASRPLLRQEPGEVFHPTR
jgi:hypothetical protein